MSTTFPLPHTLPTAAADLTVIGRAVRTSAATAAKDIPALWERLMREGPGPEGLPGADPSHLYAVYCDYQSDAHGPYTVVLGYAVDPEAKVPSDLRRVRIPAGRYLALQLRGDPREVVWKAWSAINDPTHPVGPRRYIADFECYPTASLGPDFSVVELRVGLAGA